MPVWRVIPCWSPPSSPQVRVGATSVAVCHLHRARKSAQRLQRREKFSDAGESFAGCPLEVGKGVCGMRLYVYIRVRVRVQSQPTFIYVKSHSRMIPLIFY